jgi:1-acyl-sn-glycerol-3-phosphate acyltransferase
MQGIFRPFGVLWKVLFLLHFIITLALLYPLFYLFLSRKEWYKLAFKLKRFWAHLLVFPLGIFYRVDYRFKPIAGKTYVYCANHTSYIDIILSYCMLEHYFIFMGKQELEKVPLFNIFFKDMNILVNRKSITGSYQAFQRASQELKMGHSVILFPEGTISRRAPILKDFKSGAFRLAIDEQVEIVPITFENNWKFLQDKAFLQGNMRPGIAKMVIHQPISTKGLTEKDVETLKMQVKHIIEEPLKKYKEFNQH